MGFVVGLSGSHGTGKSSILQGVKAKGYNVNESQLSRAAQAALGWDKLSRAEESVENMWLLQDAILGAMYDRDKAINDSKQLTLVERTPADVWAYTAMWCQRLNIPYGTHGDPRARVYKQHCREIMQQYYAYFIYVPIMKEIPFVEEPNRADLKSRLAVAETVDSFVLDSGHATHTLVTTNRECRVAEAVACMELARFLTGERA